MRTLPIHQRHTVAIIAAGLALVMGCSGPAMTIRSVPGTGYGQTINYRFQARIHSDSSGTCRKMVVRVRPVNKLYVRDRPPSRLQLFDDDCRAPLEFERANYVVERTGESVRLSGSEIAHFFADHFRLENELISWLFTEGVI